MKYFYSQIENLQVVIFYLIHIYIQDVGARKSYPLEDSLFFEFLIHCQPRETIYDFSLL
jgi:hypothetical protein